MTKRCMGTRPHKTFWTPTAVHAIETYQAQHQIPSFSATAETLVRMGLEHSPAEILAPIIVSTLRQEFGRQIERVIQLIVYDIIETGVAQRLAGAAVRDIGRLKQDDPERYDRIKAAAITDARRTLARTHIDQVIRELYGSREGELPPARDDGAAAGQGDEGRATGGKVLHLP